MSGLPFTPAVGRQMYLYEDEDDYIDALIYGERNSARMRPYHRLDIGFNYTKQTYRNRKAVWTFSIYNAYNRQNPYYYYYGTKKGFDNDYYMMYRMYRINDPYYSERGGKLSLYQTSFFPIIPTVSYKVYFE